MKKFILTVIALSIITPTAFAYDRYDRAKHSSMAACWYYVQSKVGDHYQIREDTPTEIWGAFGANLDKGFSCVTKNTGTEGTYVQSAISNATRP